MKFRVYSGVLVFVRFWLLSIPSIDKQEKKKHTHTTTTTTNKLSFIHKISDFFQKIFLNTQVSKELGLFALWVEKNKNKKQSI